MLDLLFIGKFDCYHVYIFYIEKTVIIPILLAFLFAVLLLPMAHFFNTKLRFPRTSRVNNQFFLFH
jgi:predicted PurR-regulated permease PerM